jgi:amidophosphoribosyltransferase
MVEKICEQLGLTSLKFNKIETLVKSIGLPKEEICTHCFDGTSYFGQGDRPCCCHCQQEKKNS